MREQGNAAHFVTFSQEIRQKIYAMAVVIGKGSAPKKINTASY